MNEFKRNDNQKEKEKEEEEPVDFGGTERQNYTSMVIEASE